MSQSKLTKQLLDACHSRDLEQVKQVLELGGNPSSVLSEHPNGLNALHLVCTQGSFNILKVLVKSCNACDIEMQDGQMGLTPLHYACLYGHFEIVEYLYSSVGSDPHSKTYDGGTALHMACRCLSGGVKALEIVKHLVTVANCDVNVSTRKGYTPLMVLMSQSNEDRLSIVRYLIFECACNLSLQNKYGNTALHIACTSGNVKYIQELLNTDNGLHSAMISNLNGDIPLHLACQHNHTECVEVVAEAYVDGLHQVNKASLTPLMCKMQQTMDNKLVSLLVQKMQENPDKDGNTPLHLACSIQNIRLANIVAELNCDPNKINNDGDTPLHLACRHDSLQLSELLLKMNSDVNIENKDGETALTIGCKKTTHSLAKLFQEKGIRNNLGETPFFIACKFGNVKLVTLMTMTNLDSYEMNNAGTTPFQAALNHGHLETVKVLMKKPTELSGISEIDWYYKRGLNPSHLLKGQFAYLLHAVCHEHDKDILKNLILRQIPDSMVKYAIGMTLHYACYYGHIYIVKHLVNDLSFSTSVKTLYDQTPLHFACMAVCSEEAALDIVKFLIAETSCDCNSQTTNGESPLMILLDIHSDWNNVIQYLVCDCHCDLLLTNGFSETVLHIACTKRNSDAVKMIVETGIDPNIEDEAGNTPLHLACRCAYKDLIAIILDSVHCGVNTVLDILICFNDQLEVVSLVTKSMHLKQDDNGNTPLHSICITNNTELATVAANAECNPNVLNKQQDTPLHIACRNSSIKMVEILLSIKDCDVNVKNKHGDSPLHLACRNKNMLIVEMLTAKQPDIYAKNNDGNTPISEAFHPHCHNLEMVWLILSHLYTTSNKRETLEHSAILYNYCDLSVLKQLVKGGLDISQFFKCNSTSLKNILHIICGQAGDINALKYFVQSYDCFLMPKDRNGWTPLHYACNYGHLDIVMYLMNELNCESQTESTKGEMPLVHVACSPCCSEEKALSVLNFLIVACKCDQNARDIDGNSPLMYLLHNRPSMKCIARYLIVECQCDLSIKNHDEDNAFHIACKTCNIDVVQILLETRSNEINAKNKEKNTPLHLACKFGHEEVVKMLLSSQNCCLYELNEASLTPLQVAETNNHLSIVSLLIYAMYDNPDDNRNTPLHIACQDKNVHLVKIILERNFNVTAANSNGDTPLHLACRSGSFKVVKLLIDDCDVDSRNKNGNTPLHEACSVGHIAIAKLLLKSSMFPDAKNYTGLTPTQCAFQHNNFKIAEILITWPGNGKLRGRKLTMEAILTKVKHLVKEGVEPSQILNIKFDKEVKTFLHAACTVGDIEAVQLLTTNSIHNHESDINGWTPLHYACYYGHYEIVHYLIEEVQSNPYITTKNGINPLQLACDSQCLKVVTYLATEGRCNPDAIVYNRDALLSYLLKSARCPLSILQYLITGYHCKLSIQDIDGNTALHIACSKVSNLDAVNMIVSRSDWPNHVRNHEGNTPLHLACMFGYSEIVKTLLETRKCGLYELNKAQCTPLEVTSNTETALLLIKEMYLCRDKDGNTPLHTACQNQNPQQIMFITKNGFDVSTRNYDNDTPLHLLCRNGNYHCTKILINSNNDLNVRNKNGDTPLSLACRHCHYHIVKMLLTTEAISNKDSNGDTPLHLACQTNSVTLVKLVLEKCSTFHIKEQNNSGNTSLHLAYKFDNARMAHLLIKTLVIKHHQGLIYSDITQENLLMEVKQLVKEGVDPSYLTWMQVDEIKKQSFLHAACGHIGDTEAVQLLAGKGNSDIKDAQGWTPLHYACIHGHLEIMTHLITQAKSNPEIATPAGTLPLQLACSHSICSEAKALNIVKFLITTAKCDPDTNVYDGDTLLIYLL